MGRVASLGRVSRWVASLGRVAGLRCVVVVADVPSSFVLPRRITPPRPSSGTLSPAALQMRPPFDNGPPLDADGNSRMPSESSEGNALLPLEAIGAADHLECIARTRPNDGTPPTKADGNSCPSPERAMEGRQWRGGGGHWQVNYLTIKYERSRSVSSPPPPPFNLDGRRMQGR